MERAAIHAGSCLMPHAGSRGGRPRHEHKIPFARLHRPPSSQTDLHRMPGRVRKPLPGQQPPLPMPPSLISSSSKQAASRCSHTRGALHAATGRHPRNSARMQGQKQPGLVWQLQAPPCMPAANACVGRRPGGHRYPRDKPRAAPPHGRARERGRGRALA